MISDGYIAIFSVLMLGSMLVSMLVNVAGLSDELCTSAGCREGRSLLPYLVATGALVAVLALARMFGPVFTSPAISAWLLSTPADRGALLRPRIWRVSALAALVTGLLAAAATTLGGFGAPAIAAYAVIAAVVAVCVVAVAVLSQAKQGHGARLLTWALAAALWVTLLLLALEEAPLLGTPETLPVSALVAGGLVAVGTVALLVVGLRLTPQLRRRDVAAGGNLAPGLSGAMASMDLALTYDVLLGHRWRGKGAVKPRRGGPSGLAALVWADVVRLTRSPQWLVIIAATVVLPYAVGVAGGERVVFLVAALVGFLAGLPLLSALRVLSRSPSVLRLLPFPVGHARRATLVVPLVVLLAHGLATVPVLHVVLDVTWGAAVLCGIASGLVSLAAGVRWVTGRPPDFGAPLVSSPAGGVPTNLYGSALRGFDVLLLAAAPVLLFPSGGGAITSMLIAAVVLLHLSDRD